MHTYIHTYIHICVHIQGLPCTVSFACICIYMCIYTYIYIYPSTDPSLFLQYICTCMHTRTRLLDITILDVGEGGEEEARERLTEKSCPLFLTVLVELEYRRSLNPRDVAVHPIRYTQLHCVSGTVSRQLEPVRHVCVPASALQMNYRARCSK